MKSLLKDRAINIEVISNSQTSTFLHFLHVYIEKWKNCTNNIKRNVLLKITYCKSCTKLLRGKYTDFILTIMSYTLKVQNSVIFYARYLRIF